MHPKLPWECSFNALEIRIRLNLGREMQSGIQVYTIIMYKGQLKIYVYMMGYICSSMRLYIILYYYNKYTILKTRTRYVHTTTTTTIKYYLSHDIHQFLFYVYFTEQNNLDCQSFSWFHRFSISPGTQIHKYLL